jgi:endonuclease/exonuclease/phosphatase family metal-dependent hydrolase
MISGDSGEHFMTTRRFCAACLTLCVTFAARAETFTVATYNIEHFEGLFEAYRLSKLPGVKDDPNPVLKEMVEEERRQNTEDQWEVATVIRDASFDPDVLVIQEGCTQSNLRYFNKQWLDGKYEAAVVFPTNTDRNQHLGVMLKPGFKILARRDRYHQEKDVVPNDRGNLLFARGPAFVLIETPSGYRCWVGVTHQKSKSGNSVEVTAWRNREAKRTHEIMRELARSGPEDVILLGDMNDEIGEDEFEKDPKSGGDTIATLVGPREHGFVLVTEQLARSGEISFGGYQNSKYRGFIDHAVTTPGMKDQIEGVSVFKGGLAPAASDHYPVIVKIRSDEPAKGRPAREPKQ